MATVSSRTRFLLILPVVFVLDGMTFGKTAESSGGTEKHSFVINRFQGPHIVDGRLDEPFWKKAQPLGGFRIDADPQRIPEVETIVYLAYTDRELLAAFVCEEPMTEKLKADVASKRGDVWKNDYCELQVFSRPETPFYSPFMQRLDYMNANEKARTQRHFIVTAANGRRDGNIYKVGPHTPYLTDDAWEGTWESAVTSQNDRCIIEIAVPWSQIGGLPEHGSTFKLHFFRRRSVSAQEMYSFNWYSGNNILVPSIDPASYIQEHATIYAPVDFIGDHAVLTRYIETEDPWKVERAHTEYERLLTGKPVPLRAVHFYLGMSGFSLPDSIRARYDDAAWLAEERNFITEIGRAGVNGPFLPGFLAQVGEAGLDSLYGQYRMQFSYHPYGNSDQAKKAGAALLRPGGEVAFFDPRYVEIKNNAMEKWLSQYGRKPWLFDIRGEDEPFNQIATLLQPGTIDMVNRELKKEFGVELGVPVGVPGALYQDQPVQENSRGVPDHETVLSRIAMFRWLNRRYADVARSEYEIVRRHAPDKLFQAYNRNSVADMDFLDQSLIDDITDYVSADPYPSFCIYVYGAARCRYHIGFTGKYVTDISVGKPTQMIIQGCDMIQRYSTPENVREWASQAAKAGVAILDWWGNPRLDHPDLYREMLRLSSLWKNLPALDIPPTSDIAVLFSDDSRVAAGDEGLHPFYSLHVILGEKLGAWFTFISENHVRRKLQGLEGKKLIVAPELAYISKETAANLIDCVQKGAYLVVLDPDALKHDIETGSLAEYRMKLLGMGECPQRSASRITATKECGALFSYNGVLPLRPLRIVENTNNARVLTVPGDAATIFTYEDGSPAAYVRPLGKGKVIVFGAMPFQDSELAIEPSGWDTFFGSILDERGIRRDLPIWDFMFPEKGGEVETFDLLR